MLLNDDDEDDEDDSTAPFERPAPVSSSVKSPIHIIRLDLQKHMVKDESDKLR